MDVAAAGMGLVYEAWENSMERRVALKVLPPGIAADDRAFQRFMREARTAGKLSHPNVVPVFATGIKEQTPYYAIEFVEGEPHQEIVAAYSEILEQCEAAGKPYIGCAIRTQMAHGLASLDAKDHVSALEDFSAARLVVPRSVSPALLEGKVWYLLDRKADADRIFEGTLAKSAPKDEVALAVQSIHADLHDDEPPHARIEADEADSRPRVTRPAPVGRESLSF
jgi:hypothetical protein